MPGNLSPLGNVFAYRHADPQMRSRVRARLDGDGGGLTVTEFGSWLVAVESLPGPSIEVELQEDPATLSVWAEGGSLPSVERARLARVAMSDPARLAQFAGDFGGLVIEGETAVIVRSCGGLVPWMVMHDADCTVVSSRVAWFARLLPTPPEPDLLVHATMTDGITLPDRRSPWKNATCLRSGTALVVQPDSAQRTVRYWHLLDRVPERSSSRARVESVAFEFRSELIRRLTTELAADGSNLLSLSGGVDSSCLAGLTHQVLKRPFNAISLCGDDSDPTTSEFKHFVDVISAATVPQRRWLFQYADRERITLPARGLRLGCPVPHPALVALPSVAKETRISVYCGGEFADDLLAGPYLLWGDWFNQLDVRSLARSFRERNNPITGKGLARLWMQDHLTRGFKRRAPSLPVRDLGAFASQELRAEHGEWKRRFLVEMPGVREPYANLVLACERDGWLLQNWEVASELGIRRSVPFVGRAVFELACSLHPADHALPPKRLLRVALGDDVPPENLWRVDKGSAAPFSDTELSIPSHVEPVLESGLLASSTRGRAVRLTPSYANPIAVLATSLSRVAPRWIEGTDIRDT